MMKQDTSRSLHGSVNVDLDPARMLQVSRLCTSLPVFASEALRICANSSVRFLPGGWLVIVAGNELFLWKYPSSSQSQSHSQCLTFTLPASDMPHSALLVAPIFAASRPVSHPTGCLALSSCGESLRIWPRLARNSMHLDVNLSASTTGLYGDEAIQLEPTSVPGTFVLATRTGHLVLVDPRNAPDGVRCRPLTGRTKIDSGGGTPRSASLLSGLSRRVSNLFGLVASTTGGFGTRLTPAKGGGNMVFVRLVTRSIAGTSTDDTICLVYMLLESQLDVWSIDHNLDEQMLGVYSIQSLLQSSTQDSVLGQWHAVDMAVQHSTQPNMSNDFLYLLVSNAASGPRGAGVFQLVTLEVGNEDQPGGQVFQVIPVAAVQIEWPFELSSMWSTSFQPRMIHLCLPASPAPDASGTPLYPCLLASLFFPFTGQVMVIEVLTGHKVARMEFGPMSTGSNTLAAKPPTGPSALIGCGSVDSSNLFVYVTCQRGLITLTPVNDVLPSGGGGSQSVADLSHSSIHELTKTGSKLRASNASIDSLATTDSQRPRADRHPIILVHTSDGPIQVVAQLTPSGVLVWDPNDIARSPIQLSPADLCFVGLGEAVRVYWMGYQEQATKCVVTLATEQPLRTELSSAFLRLTSRLMNERPLSDARWRSLTLPAYSERESLMPEGCSVFQYVVSRSTSETPLLSIPRLQTKLDSIKRLREVWSIVLTSDLLSCSDVFMPLTELCHWLRIRSPSTFPTLDTDLSVSQQDSDELESNRRWYAGEQPGVLSETGSAIPEHSSRFHCILADDTNEVEACAERLLRSLDENRMLQAAEDDPMDNAGRPALVHLLCGMHLAEELVEFTRIIQTKLAQEPKAMLQRVFQSVAVQAGFSSTALQVVNPQEAVLQTVSLMPSFVAGLGEAVLQAIRSGEFDFGIESEDERMGSSPTLISANAFDLFTGAMELLTPALSAVLIYRDRQLPSLYEAVGGFGATRSHYLACWLTDCRPYGVGDVLLNLFELLIRFGSGEISVMIDQHPPNGESARSDSTQIMKDACSWAVEWANVLLGVAHQRVRWATVHSSWIWSHAVMNNQLDSPSVVERVESVQRLRRMRSWFVQLRKYFIDSVADRLNRPEAALHLAERFADCAQMVRLCYLLERQDEIDHAAVDSDPIPTVQLTRFHHHRLAELLRRVPASYGLADQALQWYFDCEEHARVKSLLALLERMKDQTTSIKDEPHTFAKPKVPQYTVSSSVVEQKPKQAVERERMTVDPVNRFLRRHDTRDHAWPHLLSTRQYSKASQILFEEGCKETRSVGRRKVLLSLAKLSLLATDSKMLDTAGDRHPDPVSSEVAPDPLLEKIDLLLEVVQIQERLPVELRAVCPLLQMQSDQLDPRYDPLLDLDTLARLYISGASLAHAVPLLNSADTANSTDSDAPLVKCGREEFHTAFRLADLVVELEGLQPVSHLLGSEESRHQLLLHIWCQALKMNDWTNTMDHEDPVDICSRSFVCSLVRDLSRTHAKALEILFTPDELFNHPELMELSSDPRFRYLVQSGIEYMQSLST